MRLDLTTQEFTLICFALSPKKFIKESIIMKNKTEDLSIKLIKILENRLK